MPVEQLTQAPEEVTTTDDGDHDRFTHIVQKRDLEKALSTGGLVRALCGKVWRPGRDPSRYPICPTCSEINAELMRLKTIASN